MNVRLVTALAILPFAQALDTGTYFFEAVSVFVSPELTLSILQMAVLIGGTVSAARHWPERTARHARILAVIAFITANLCALVGSLFGDVIGETLWGPLRDGPPDGMDWDDWWEIVDAYHATALTISEAGFCVLWALALAAMIAWGAFNAHRGLFNTALTFAAIHAYTQLFESFGKEPLAYVIGGLAEIPLAWGMWRLNHWITGNAPGARS